MKGMCRHGLVDFLFCVSCHTEQHGELEPFDVWSKRVCKEAKAMTKHIIQEVLDAGHQLGIRSGRDPIIIPKSDEDSAEVIVFSGGKNWGTITHFGIFGPVTPWQRFKQRHAGKFWFRWFIRRFPVKDELILAGPLTEC